MCNRESLIGNEEDCQEFARGTDPQTAGWWYHGATEERCQELSSGAGRFRGRGPHHFTRDPLGAQYDATHTHAIRVMVNLKNGIDQFGFGGGDFNALAAGFDWLRVLDASRIMVQAGYINPPGEAEGLG